MRYCPRVKNIVGSWDFKPGFLSLVRLRCRQWDCEFCSTKNADMWRAHLLKVFCEVLTDEHWVFVTLTVPPWAHEKPPAVSLGLLKKAWDGMYDKLRYLNKGKLKYVLVYETHASGVFHVHALCNVGDVYDAYGVSIDRTVEHEAIIEQEKAHPFCVWLKEKATEEKLGWVCHATRIQEGATGKDNARLAVSYLTKYFTKGVRDVVLPKRMRRVCTSRDIGSPRSKSKQEFSWSLKPSIHYKTALEIPLWNVTEARALDASDFGDDGYYPPIENA